MSTVSGQHFFCFELLISLMQKYDTTKICKVVEFKTHKMLSTYNKLEKYLIIGEKRIIITPIKMSIDPPHNNKKR